MYVLFIPIVWFTFQYNFMHYAQFFQEFYWVLAISVSLWPTLCYAIYGCECSSKKCVSIEEGLAATTIVKQRNTVLWKKLFPATDYNNLQGENVLEEQLLYFGSQSFLMNLYLLFR